jgi:multiple sugar transport system ATP-binding protein
LDAHGAFEAKVSLIEPMGNHHVVWLDFGGLLLSSILTGPLHVAVDQMTRFTVDLTKISLLDKSSEQRL